MPKTYASHAQQIAHLGVILPATVSDYLPQGMALDSAMANDSQSALVTVGNSGIPAFLTNYVDPALIEVLTSPCKGALILGENKKGDWCTPTALFPVVESAGEVSSYDDRTNNGAISANVNWPQRQSYHFQTVTQWGEKELEMMGKGRIDWANRLNISAARIMDKFRNKTYFSGISGLQNYGILNDPALSAPGTPSTKAAGGTTWALGTSLEIYNDIKAMFVALVAQSKGTIEMSDKMKLCMSPEVSVSMTTVSTYGQAVSVEDMLKKSFPNLSIETAVEYATISGQVVQLIAEAVDGQDVGYCSFTEKMRAHPVKVDLSSFAQKKSGGTWGAIILQPFAITQLIGV